MAEEKNEDVENLTVDFCNAAMGTHYEINIGEVSTFHNEELIELSSMLDSKEVQIQFNERLSPRFKLFPDDVERIVGVYLTGSKDKLLHEALIFKRRCEEAHFYVFRVQPNFLKVKSANDMSVAYILPFNPCMWLRDRSDQTQNDEMFVFKRALNLRMAFNYKLISLTYLLYNFGVAHASSISERNLMEDLNRWSLLIALVLFFLLYPFLQWYVAFFSRSLYGLFALVFYPFIWIKNKIAMSYHSWKYTKTIPNDRLVQYQDNVQMGSFLKKEVLSDGSKIYYVKYDGLIIKATPQGDDYDAEMSMPNSTLVKSKERPVGVIIIEGDDGTYHVVGGFFRVNNYLVTANHVANIVVHTLGKFYLARVKMDTGKKLAVVDEKKFPVDQDQWDPDNNVCSEQLDLFVIKLTDVQWSSLGIKQVEAQASSFGMEVSSTGVVNHILFTAFGQTRKASQPWLLEHTASTNKGFSGFPVFRGSKVVGMHLGGSVKSNEMLRIEFILYCLGGKESLFDIKGVKVYGKRNVRGNLGSKKVHFGGKVWYQDDEGYIELGDDDFPPSMSTLSRLQYTKDFVMDELPYRRGSVPTIEYVEECDQEYVKEENLDEISTYYDPLDYNVVHTKPVPIPPPIGKFKSLSVDTKVSRKKKTKPSPKFGDSGWKEVGRTQPIHQPKLPNKNLKTIEYMEQHKSLLNRLGYEPGVFDYPTLSSESEESSLKYHLDLFHDRCKKAGVKNVHDVNGKAVALTKTWLNKLRFKLRKGWKSREVLADIVNSSVVGDSKSAGIPYVQQGLPLNRDVIKNYGVDGLVDIVLEKWNEPVLCRTFNKCEPHKRSKLDQGRIRIITGLPLHKLIKHASLLQDFTDVSVDKWFLVPTKGPFSNSAPRNNIHLRDWLQGYDKYWSTDKSGWDFNMFEKHWYAVTQVIIGLAAPYDSSEQAACEFDEWKVDMRKMAQELANADYVLSNGKILRSHFPGIMKSGFFGTLPYNTVAQAYHHAEVLLKCNATQSDKDKPIAIKGDDVAQVALESITKEEYSKASAELGIEVEIEENVGFDGVEFCSCRYYTQEDDTVSAIPSRFNKHIEHIKRIKETDLPHALLSYMNEWCWVEDKFNFFFNMYSDFGFNLGDAKDRHMLTMAQSGQEGVGGAKCYRH